MIYGYANASWLGLDKFRDRAPERDVRTVAPLPPVVIGFGQRTIDATPSLERQRQAAMPLCRICEMVLQRGKHVDGAHLSCAERAKKQRVRVVPPKAVALGELLAAGKKRVSGKSAAPHASLPASGTHAPAGSCAPSIDSATARPCGAERARCVRGAR